MVWVGLMIFKRKHVVLALFAPYLLLSGGASADLEKAYSEGDCKWIFEADGYKETSKYGYVISVPAVCLAPSGVVYCNVVDDSICGRLGEMDSRRIGGTYYIRQYKQSSGGQKLTLYTCKARNQFASSYNYECADSVGRQVFTYRSGAKKSDYNYKYRKPSSPGNTYTDMVQF